MKYLAILVALSVAGPSLVAGYTPGNACAACLEIVDLASDILRDDVTSVHIRNLENFVCPLAPLLVRTSCPPGITDIHEQLEELIKLDDAGCDLCFRIKLC